MNAKNSLIKTDNLTTASDSRRRVVFLPYSETSWSRMLPQIRALRRSGNTVPHVVIASERAAKVADACRNMVLDHTVLGAIPRHDRANVSWLESRVRSDRLLHGLPFGLIRMYQVRRRLAMEKARFVSLLKDLDARALVVQGDRELGPNPGALAAAQALGIPRIIGAPGVPSVRALAVLRRGQVRFRADWKSAPPLLNLLAAAQFPRQARKTDFGRLLFSPGWLTLALGAEGMLSDNPWCLGGGHSEHVLIDSGRKRDLFIDLGVDPTKLELIGDLDLDALHRAWVKRKQTRKAIVSRYRLDPQQDVTIFSIPIYGEHGLMPMDSHLSELDAVFEKVAARRSNVILSMHPKSQYETYAAMAARHGFVIAHERLSCLLPAADLFLCGSSTTIEWAVLTGVPTINIDYCGLDDVAFRSLSGVLRVATAHELDGVLSRLALEPAWANALCEAQRRSALDFALFDGQAEARFVRFIDRVTCRRSKAATARGSIA